VQSHGAIQINEAPLILRGEAPVLGWSDTWLETVHVPVLRAVRSLYKASDTAMSESLEAGLKADRLATRFAGNGGNVSSLRQAFRAAGALIAADTGPRIAVLSVDGWDTHADQGGTTGYMSEVLTELDLALNDFKTAVGSKWSETVAVCATEFGRTVKTNGDSGTDHGVATAALLCGGAVNGGGKVKGDWPGLANLYEDSDLRPTTDLRSVFKGILRDHVGVATSLLNTSIFPGSATEAPPMRNLIKTSEASPLADGGKRARTREETPIARYRRGQKVSRPRHIAGAGVAG
jgi:uncharacterized protein (DUF1501 family)